MATNLKDESGKVYGDLTVLYKDNTKKGGAAYWICQCSCGNIISVRGQALREGKTNCGCKRKPRVQDTTSLIGKRFGKLTVLERDLSVPSGRGHDAKWICKCDCGNITSVRTTSLNNGHTISCGCYRKERLSQQNTKDLTGQRFGKLIAQYKTNRQYHNTWIWHCVCDCGNEIDYQTDRLLEGSATSCGCNYGKSHGEQKIQQLLDQFNVKYLAEFTFPDLKDKLLLRYDFAILNDKDEVIRLIEFDGSQHFLTKPNGRFTQSDIDTIKKHDIMKNNYAHAHNIPIIRIPYTDLDIFTFEDLFSNKYII